VGKSNRRRTGNNNGKRLPQLASAWRLSGFAQLKLAIKITAILWGLSSFVQLYSPKKNDGENLFSPS